MHKQLGLPSPPAPAALTRADPEDMYVDGDVTTETEDSSTEDSLDKDSLDQKSNPIAISQLHRGEKCTSNLSAKDSKPPKKEGVAKKVIASRNAPRKYHHCENYVGSRPSLSKHSMHSPHRRKRPGSNVVSVTKKRRLPQRPSSKKGPSVILTDFAAGYCVSC